VRLAKKTTARFAKRTPQGSQRMVFKASPCVLCVNLCVHCGRKKYNRKVRKENNRKVRKENNRKVRKEYFLKRALAFFAVKKYNRKVRKESTARFAKNSF
jgi:hypothetical protein